MKQAKFSIKEDQAKFISKYREHGFKDKSDLVRAAINRFRKKLELERIKKSAEIYTEIYSEDDDLQTLTESAAEGWPE